MDERLQELLDNFASQFAKNLKAANNSGALSGNESIYILGRCLLVLTAENFYNPKHAESKKLLANLRHFV